MEQSESSSRSPSFTRTFSSTKVFLRKQLWVWPVIAAALLGTIGSIVHGIVEDAVKSTMADNLKTILDADVMALRIWIETRLFVYYQVA